jgi:23S rRNA (pseudouridine1915-N3)-methyltransferase
VKTTLLTVGKVQASPFQEAEAHYVKLLSRYQPVEVVEARDDEALVSRLPQKGLGLVVAVDLGGRQMNSMDWSMWLSERRLEARDLTFLVGGPAGLPKAALDAAGQSVSLGPQTMAHQLARVVVLEQLYRAAKILAGEPYHL